MIDANSGESEDHRQRRSDYLSLQTAQSLIVAMRTLRMTPPTYGWLPFSSRVFSAIGLTLAVDGYLRWRNLAS